MKAIVVNPGVVGRLEIQDVEPPQPRSGEALIQVSSISLNRGEVRRSQSAEAGYRPGWDLSGVVMRAAADGSGPSAGTRVVGFVESGGWAEQVAVPTDAVAALPDSVSFAQAATLPVAGLTALYALDKANGLLGRGVLVTGASGGVGHFAVQLARKAGAKVVGVVRQANREQFVRESGAHEVVVSEDVSGAAAFGPYHLVVDGVGGPGLANALTMLARGGIAVVYGATSGPELTFDLRRFYGTGALTLYGFILFQELRRSESVALGLARLAGLVAAGDLRPPIELEAPWADIGSVAERFFNRDIPGKVVLHIQS